MRRNMKKGSCIVVGLVALAAAPAMAATAGSASGRGSSAPTPPPTPGGSHSAQMHDAGPPETNDQRKFRYAYVNETLKKEIGIVKGHVWTPDMATVMIDHWRRAYRVLRIRELAEDDKDMAVVARADVLLNKTTDRFLTQLKDVTAKSPEIPPPPTISAPANGASLAVGTPVTFKITPVKDATEYHCSLFQAQHGGYHVWNNYNAAAKSYGTSPDCTIAADDARWTKFNSGKATLYAHAIIKAKSSDGKEYRYWTQGAKSEFSLTGGAAPTPSGAPSAKGSSSAGGAK